MTKSESDKRLEQLEATNEIRQLVYKYAYALDTFDYKFMETLWVETDKPVDPPTMDIHLMRNLREILTGMATSTLFVGNHLITLDGPDRARGSVYCLAFVDWSGVFFDQSIVYQDHYERHDGKWLFLKRDHLLMWGQERKPHPMQQTPANWPESQIGAGNGFDLLRHDLPPKQFPIKGFAPYRPV